jgi:hypothetical protein
MAKTILFKKKKGNLNSFTTAIRAIIAENKTEPIDKIITFLVHIFD